MFSLKVAERSQERAVEFMRRTQNSDGCWAGSVRSNMIVWYAAGLALKSTPTAAAPVQDICDFIESCATASGGIAAYPGEPAGGYETALALPVLRWARPNSPVLERGEDYLRRNFSKIQDPVVQVLRYIFEENSRLELLRDRGPAQLARLAAMRGIPLHPTAMWKLPKIFTKRALGLSIFQRRVIPWIMRARTFPPENHLSEAASKCSGLTGFDIFVMVPAAMSLLRRDSDAAGRRVQEFAAQWRPRYRFDDDTFEWISDIIIDAFYCAAAGLQEEKERALQALEHISYEGSGWLNGREIRIDVFDTALTMLALRQCGIPSADPQMQKAESFLREGRSPAHGMWSWDYSHGMGSRRRYCDTDDTALACMALANSRTGDAAVSTAAQGLLTMQEKSGAFSTFGDGNLRPNFCWLSNSARALQALICGGMTLSDEPVRRCLSWILAEQLPDGSWIDGWCSRYIYGTAIAIETLLSIKETDAYNAVVARAVQWLSEQQNPDGGWGEDWRGALSASTAEHTGLAVYALALAADKNIACSPAAIEKGLDWLCHNQTADGGWNACYFVNFGFGTGFADSHLPVVWALHGLGAGLKALRRTFSTRSGHVLPTFA